MTTSLQLLDSPLLLNLLVQATVFSALALFVLRKLKQRAVWSYAIAYSSLIGLGLLAVLSLFTQAQNRALFVMPINLVAFAEQRLEFLSPLFASESAPEFAFELPSQVELDVPFAGGLGDLGTTAPPSFIYVQFSWIIPGLAMLWVLGIIAGIGRLLFAAVQLRALDQRAVALTPRQRQRINNTLQSLEQDLTRVSVRVSHEVASPVQIGFLRAQLLLPSQFIEHCTVQQLEAVLLHELAHWQRRDNVANLLQKIIVCLFWFHPLIHRLDQIAAQSREEICDNFVLTRHSAVDYGETLFWISAMQERAGAVSFRNNNMLAAEIIGPDWNLEERIRELIDQKRETAMQLSTKSALVVRFTTIGISALVASCILVPTAGPVSALEPQSTQTTNNSQVDQTDAQTQRSPPPARSSERLSAEIMQAITEIQALLVPAEEQEEPDLEAAKRLLDTLYEERFAGANSFEQATILNFYTNYYLSMDDYPEAIRIFEQLLTVENLREDVQLRTLRSLGQLYAVEEQWQPSIDAYAGWLGQSNQADGVVFRGLSYAHYQLEQWQDSLDYWMRYWNTMPSEELSRDDYAFRNGLYFTLADYASALELTKEMILRFNNETDWGNLQAIYALLQEDAATAEQGVELGGTLNQNPTESEIFGATFIISTTDGDYRPLVAIAPQYPTGAAQDGIEGWCLVSFTVDGLGNVVEDSIVVVDADPPEIFDRSSQRAAALFKFQPRTVAGEAQVVPGVQYLFRYTLRDDDA